MSEGGPDGLLVVDKPSGLTSHDVVARVRRIAGTKRVGHTGTLDPMATGVLVLCLGKATRLVPFIEETGGARAKAYEASIRFGFETSTDDSEGEPRGGAASTSSLTAEGVASALASFVGEIDQVPPAVSAKKVGGKRAYALARRGSEVELKAVRVQVASARLLSLEGDMARAAFECSRGTYIRALARDLGRALGVGAHLAALRRTRSGTASVEAAVRLDDLTPSSLSANLIPMMPVLDTWPSVIVGEGEAADLRQGRAIALGATPAPPGTRLRIGDAAGNLLALATVAGARAQPFCVF